jgi:hypothetical protein
VDEGWTLEALPAEELLLPTTPITGLDDDDDGNGAEEDL